MRTSAIPSAAVAETMMMMATQLNVRLNSSSDTYIPNYLEYLDHRAEARHQQALPVLRHNMSQWLN